MQRSPIGNLLSLHLRRDKRLPLPTTPPAHPDVAVSRPCFAHTMSLGHQLNVRKHPDGYRIELIDRSGK
jgi:hypothetical protein